MATLAQHVDVAFWLKAAAVGFVSGVLSGMFGVGGGIITTPAIRFVLGGSAMAAVASSLPAIIPSALAGAFSYTRHGVADVRGGLVIGFSGAVTAVGAALLTRFIGGNALLIVTAVIIGVMAFDMVRFAATPAELPEPAVREAEEASFVEVGERPAARLAATPAVMVGLGVAAGVYSGLLGLGGGFLIVTVLTRLAGFPVKRAIGTSLLSIAILAVPATVTHAVLGHIDWTIGIALAVMVIPGSLLGARLTRKSPERWVRIGFALLLVLSAVALIVNESAELLS